MARDPHQTEGFVFETDRLRVRAACPDDVELIHSLWTDPRVMTFVGFPNGLRTSHDEIRSQLEREARDPAWGLLIVEREQDRRAIGQAHLARPDADGVSEPDIKLLPEFWRQTYGREAWKGLIDHTFANADCLVVQGTPNAANTASIRMMESCGMVRSARGRIEPAESMAAFAEAVEHYVYRMTREDWQKTSPDQTA